MKNNMQSKKFTVKTYIYLVLFLLLAAVFLWVDNYTQTLLPDCHEIRTYGNEYSSITFEEADKLNISASSVYKETSLQNSIGSSKDIKFVLTDHNFAEYYNLNIIAGQFFDKYTVKKSGYYTIISDGLALELFLSYDAIGKKIIIDNFEYEVIGVYKYEKNFYSTLAQDLYERIYIPYTTVSDAESLQITSFAIGNDKNIYNNIDKAFVKYPFLKYTSKQISYKEKRAYASQFPSYMIFAIQLYAVFLLGNIIYKSIYNLIKLLKSQNHQYYLKDTLKNNRKKILSAVLLSFICFSVIFIIMKNISLKIVMSTWFMPEDNLFDIHHYLDKITLFFMDKNTYQLPGNNYFTNLTDLTLFFSVISLLFLFPILAALINSFKKLSNSNYMLALEMMFLLLIIFVICLVKTSSAAFFMNSALILMYLILTFGLNVVRIKFFGSNSMDN